MKVILNDKGMTVVELLFATFLIAFVLIALLTLMMGGLTTVSFAKTQTLATALANERIEVVRGMSYVDIGLQTVSDPNTTPSGTLPSENDTHEQYTRGGQNFEVWYEVVWVDDVADNDPQTSEGTDTDGDRHDYKRITVNVSWSGPFPNSRVRVVTNIREKTSSTDAPTVDFVSPTPASMTAVKETQTVGATASDTDGQIVTLRFYFQGHTPSGAIFNENSSSVTESYSWNTTEINPDTGDPWYADGAREVKVQVWDNAGATSYKVIYLVVDNAAPSFSPGNPLFGSPTNYDTVTLTWSAATDGTDRVEYYFIYRSTDGVNWTKTSVGPSNLSYNPTTGEYAYTYSGLQPWTNYQFYIEARSPLNVQNGSGDFVTASNVDSDNTTLIHLTGNWTKQGMSYKNNLSWTSVPAGVICTGFDIYRNGSFYTSTTSFSYTDSSVTKGQTYVYQIKAKNGSDVINISNNLSLTPGS